MNRESRSECHEHQVYVREKIRSHSDPGIGGRSSAPRPTYAGRNKSSNTRSAGRHPPNAMRGGRRRNPPFRNRNVPRARCTFALCFSAVFLLFQFFQPFDCECSFFFSSLFFMTLGVLNCCKKIPTLFIFILFAALFIGQAENYAIRIQQTREITGQEMYGTMIREKNTQHGNVKRRILDLPDVVESTESPLPNTAVSTEGYLTDVAGSQNSHANCRAACRFRNMSDGKKFAPDTTKGQKISPSNATKGQGIYPPNMAGQRKSPPNTTKCQGNPPEYDSLGDRIEPSVERVLFCMMIFFMYQVYLYYPEILIDFVFFSFFANIVILFVSVIIELCYI